MTKTITEKLQLHKYTTKLILNMPANISYFADLQPYDTSITNTAYELIIAFVQDEQSLVHTVTLIQQQNLLEQNGYFFVAYPKKGNMRYNSFIHRDHLFPLSQADDDGFIQGSKLKFSRMVGLDETFTIVGFKYGTDKSTKPSTAASQRVDDYAEFVEQIAEILTDHADLQQFYHQLTAGYRKDWARYIFSAKQETTQQKRIEEMKMILSAGFKSRELYRRSQA